MRRRRRRRGHLGIPRSGALLYAAAGCAPLFLRHLHAQHGFIRAAYEGRQTELAKKDGTPFRELSSRYVLFEGMCTLGGGGDNQIYRLGQILPAGFTRKNKVKLNNRAYQDSLG